MLHWWQFIMEHNKINLTQKYKIVCFHLLLRDEKGGGGVKLYSEGYTAVSDNGCSFQQTACLRAGAPLSKHGKKGMSHPVLLGEVAAAAVAHRAFLSH